MLRREEAKYGDRLECLPIQRNPTTKKTRVASRTGTTAKARP
jgi:hypothetical protein